MFSYKPLNNCSFSNWSLASDGTISFLKMPKLSLGSSSPLRPPLSELQQQSLPHPDALLQKSPKSPNLEAPDSQVCIQSIKINLFFFKKNTESSSLLVFSPHQWVAAAIMLLPMNGCCDNAASPLPHARFIWRRRTEGFLPWFLHHRMRDYKPSVNS